MKITGKFVQVPVSVRDDPKLDEHAKIVFFVLLTYANDELRCWPSVKTIAAGASIKQRAVYYAINLLEKTDLDEKTGWLTITPRPGRPSVYQLFMRRTAYTPALSAEVSPQSSINIHGSVIPPLHSVHTTPALSADELYLLKEKEEREGSFSSSQDKSDQDKKQEASLACSYVDGHFHVERAARAWLLDRHPSINLDTIVTRAEARLSKQKPREIVNALAYLDACCSKAGGAIPEQPGHTTRTSEPATESQHRNPDDEWRALQERLLHVKVKKS